MPVDAQPVLRFAKLSDHAFAPTKGSSKAAGFDLKRFACSCQICAKFKLFLNVLLCKFYVYALSTAPMIA